MTDDAYARVAPVYDRLLGRLNAPLNALLTEVAPASDGEHVLDVGCGTGSHLEGYVAMGAACSGIDLSPAMLAVARRRLPPDVVLEHGDATDLPFDDETFDLVIASLFLHELDPDALAAVLGEMARVTREGGRIAVLDYRVGSMRWQGRAWRAFSTVVEFLAGRAHYRAWRSWLASGGITARQPPGTAPDREKIVAGGNLAIRVTRKFDH